MRKIFDFILGVSARQLTIALVVVFIFNQVVNRWLTGWVLDILNTTSEDSIVRVFNFVNSVGVSFDLLLIVIVILLIKKLY